MYNTVYRETWGSTAWRGKTIPGLWVGEGSHQHFKSKMHDCLFLYMFLCFFLISIFRNNRTNQTQNFSSSCSPFIRGFFMGEEGTFSRMCIFTSSLMAFPSLLSWFLHHFQMTEQRACTIFSFLAVDNYSYLCTREYSCSRLQAGWAIPSSLPRKRGRKGRDSRVHCTAQWALRMDTSSCSCRVRLLRTLS